MKYLLAGIFLGAVGVHPVAIFAVLLVAWMAESEHHDGK